jgi:DNA-binding transcriptional MerR regulator
MKVTELSRRTGASPRSIRHYDTAGLLTSRRRANGYREFGEEAVTEVQAIQELLKAGLTVEAIGQLKPSLVAHTDRISVSETQRALEAHIAQLAARLARDVRTLNVLRAELSALSDHQLQQGALQ